MHSWNVETAHSKKHVVHTNFGECLRIPGLLWMRLRKLYDDEVLTGRVEHHVLHVIRMLEDVDLVGKAPLQFTDQR